MAVAAMARPAWEPPDDDNEDGEEEDGAMRSSRVRRRGPSRGGTTEKQEQGERAEYFGRRTEVVGGVGTGGGWGVDRVVLPEPVVLPPPAVAHAALL